MTALVLNVITAILGALAASGVKVNLSPETIAQLAGALATVIAIANQWIHSARDKDAPGSSQKGFASVPVLLVLAALAIAVSACAGTPSITPDQLATVTKENHAAVGCGAGTGLYGRGNVVFVNAEHASVASGKLTVSADCTVTIEANLPVPK